MYKYKQYKADVEQRRLEEALKSIEAMDEEKKIRFGRNYASYVRRNWNTLGAHAGFYSDPFSNDEMRHLIEPFNTICKLQASILEGCKYIDAIDNGRGYDDSSIDVNGPRFYVVGLSGRHTRDEIRHVIARNVDRFVKTIVYEWVDLLRACDGLSFFKVHRAWACGDFAKYCRCENMRTASLARAWMDVVWD